MEGIFRFKAMHRAGVVMHEGGCNRNLFLSVASVGLRTLYYY